MASKKLDWNNLLGILTFALIKDFSEIERNILELFKGLEVPQAQVKSKNKTVFATRVSESTSDEESRVHSTYIPPKQWYANGLKFPSLLEGHSHEMYECLPFLSMKPTDGNKLKRIGFVMLVQSPRMFAPDVSVFLIHQFLNF